MHLIRQAFFGMSQKIDGLISFLHCSRSEQSFPHRSPSNSSRTSTSGITNPYGDFLMSLDKGYTQVGIYYSPEAEALSRAKAQFLIPKSWPPRDCGSCVHEGRLSRALITDEQLLDHRGDRYKVIFAPGIVYEDETDPQILKELQAAW